MPLRRALLGRRPMAGVEGKKAPEDQQASAPSRATAMATPRDVALHFRILPTLYVRYSAVIKLTLYCARACVLACAALICAPIRPAVSPATARPTIKFIARCSVSAPWRALRGPCTARPAAPVCRRRVGIGPRAAGCARFPGARRGGGTAPILVVVAGTRRGRVIVRRRCRARWAAYLFFEGCVRSLEFLEALFCVG